MSPKNRLNQLQRFLHRYTFTSLPDKPGGDPWGLLSFDEEEKRFGSDFIRAMRAEYDETLGKLLTENPESQFGQIITQPYYKKGFFPRLRNETLEVMDAFSRVEPDGQGSGKCAALGMLWAAALIIWGRFSPEKITIMGNQAHMFVFLDEEDGHLLNNGKWFSSTRINNQSELSEIARMVSSSAESTFFYSPSHGICNCTVARSEIKVTLTGAGEDFDEIFFVQVSEREKKGEQSAPASAEEPIGLPECIRVYETARDGSMSWTDLENNGVEFGYDVIMHPFAENEKLEKIYVNMDSSVLKNYRSKLTGGAEQYEVADKKYVSAVYFHTLFLYTITKNRKYSLFQGESEESRDISEFLKDLFQNHYASFLLNFGLDQLIDSLD